jgi:hypothetical protein
MSWSIAPFRILYLLDWQHWIWPFNPVGSPLGLLLAYSNGNILEHNSGNGVLQDFQSRNAEDA